MYNSGGAVETVEALDASNNGGISIKGRGTGRFGAYSNEKPKLCSVNSKEEAFTFRDEDNLLTITIPSGTNFWEIVVSYKGHMTREKAYPLISSQVWYDFCK